MTAEQLDYMYLETDDKLKSAVNAFEYAEEIHDEYLNAVSDATGVKGISYDGVKVQTSHTSYDDALLRVLEFSERYNLTGKLKTFEVAAKMAGCRNKQQAWRTYKAAFCKCALAMEKGCA